MLYSSCIILQSWYFEANPGPGWVKELLTCFSLEFKEYLGRRHFQSLADISLFKCHQFDIFGLTETFIDYSIFSEDPRLGTEGYKLFCCNHPSNLQRGGFCLYFKDYLLLAIRSNLTTVDGCLVCEFQNGSKRVFKVVVGFTIIESH